MLRTSIIRRCETTIASSSSPTLEVVASTTTTQQKKRPPRPMISEKRRETLKNMYELVGTHSAVKLCRWQKSMLRGFGGCYKWTLYGISSHQCMEATPSLACSSKCVFCWRLSTNPTITEWNFFTDEPRELVGKMLDAQVKLIKSTAAGMHGVVADRLEESYNPRHCALSLVGEPIIYPRINEFLDELHTRKISSFLVNNGSFPEQINTLTPITQLYLSVDATDKETMKWLDRPIFPDFWERHAQSIRNMKHRKERTVFRLTMIEDVNMSDDDITRLVEMIKEAGQPGLIELKQLTPAFQSRTTPLRMRNVPKWPRLIEFATKLCEALPRNEYTIPAVHEHSSCILVANKEKYSTTLLGDGKTKRKWYTWIDFDKFNELVMKDPKAETWDFRDYLLESPEWALLKEEGKIPIADRTALVPGLGFDPNQERKFSNKMRKARAEAGEKEKKQL